jgi:hypothetical protein
VGNVLTASAKTSATSGQTISISCAIETITKNWPALKAWWTAAARRCPAEDHVISGNDTIDVLANRPYDARAFMTQHQGSAGGPIAACRMEITVTNARRFHLDQYLASAWFFQFSLLNGEWLALFP